MSSNPLQNDTFNIRCPACSAKFSVGKDMPGGLVQCRNCNHRFEVLDRSNLRSSKVFPGEKRDPLLSRMTKVSQPLPRADDKHAPRDFASHANLVYREPLSAKQILLIAVALFGVAVTAVFLVYGTKQGGALFWVGFENRIILAGFVGAMATGLLVFSNSRSWLRMLLLGLTAGGALLAVPFYYQGGAKDMKKNVLPDSKTVAEGKQQPKPEPTLTNAELRAKIGTEPLEKERSRILKSKEGRGALGLWLRDLRVSHRLQVKEYIVREMKASLQTHFYPREGDDYLLVVTGIDEDLEKLGQVASAFGKVKAIHNPLHVVEVVVDNDRFKSCSMEILTNPDDPRFYVENLQELHAIDLSRISAAVRRISEVKPSLLRDDFSRRLTDLLANNWYEDKGEISRALLTWSLDDGKAGEISLKQALRLHSVGKEVPAEMVALCIQQQEMGVLPLLYKLWEENPSRWEPWFREAGVAAEHVMLDNFENNTGILRQSACRILGQVGTGKSLLVLREVADAARDAETKITASTSIQMIEKRESESSR